MSAPTVPPFVPEQQDVYRARAYLHYRLGLPNELVLDILDKARYWVERTRASSQYEVLHDEEFSTNFSAALPYLGVQLDIRTTASRETRHLREIEFLIVSHDQGWTTEDTTGTYKTSSWFDVSIIRPSADRDSEAMYEIGEEIADTFRNFRGPQTSNIHAALESFLGETGAELVPRPSPVPEPQRMHCDELRHFRFLEGEEKTGTTLPPGVEGSHAWYLQSNEVARATSTFEGEYIRRYRVVWGCKANPIWVGNEGSGSGECFVDTLQYGDWICVWARAKVCWSILGDIFTTTKAIDRDEDGRTISMAFASPCGTTSSDCHHRSFIRYSVLALLSSSHATLVPLTKAFVFNTTPSTSSVSRQLEVILDILINCIQVSCVNPSV
jgi:hypothetical protein